MVIFINICIYIYIYENKSITISSDGNLRGRKRLACCMGLQCLH